MADPTQIVEQRVGLAPEIAPYAQTLLGTAQKFMADTPYQSYQDWAKSQGLTGEQIAQFTPLQQEAFQSAGALDYSPESIEAAQGLGSAAEKAAAYSYAPSTFQGGTFDQGAAQQYMNPYMQSVVDIQKREAQRQSGIQGLQQQAQATQSGAFGGSRDAIMRAERERNLGQQMGDIQAQGSNAAFQQAQAQFNADQARRMQAQQLGEQSSQYGAGIGLQGLQTGMQGFSNLGTIGQNLYGQNIGNIGLQQQLGTQQQQQMQNVLGTQQANYAAAQNYPYKQMGFMSDIIRGVPLSATGSTVYQAPPSMLSQVAGLGAVGKGVGLFANGGAVTRMAKGGLVKSKNAGLAALLVHSMG